MSYLWDVTTSTAVSTTTPITVPPFTAVAWINLVAAAGNRAICHIARDGTNDYFLGNIATPDTTYNVFAHTRSTTIGQTGAASSSQIATASWVMVHFKWGATDNRVAGHNATNEGSQGTDIPLTGAPDVLRVGTRGGDQMLNGKMATLAIYNKVLSNQELTDLLTVIPSGTSSYSDCVAFYDFRADQGTVEIDNVKSPGNHILTLGGTTKPVYDADNPSLGSGTVKTLKILVHPDAATGPASGVEGIVWAAGGIAGAEYGEFTGKTFEAATEGTGDAERAVLLVPVADFNGGALVENDVVPCLVRNATYTTGLITGTVIEE